MKSLTEALKSWAEWYSQKLDSQEPAYSGFEQDLFEALGCSSDPEIGLPVVNSMASAPKDRPIFLIDPGHFYGLQGQSYMALAIWEPSTLFSKGGSWVHVYGRQNFCGPIWWCEAPRSSL